jgi:hypothetical protein
VIIANHPASSPLGKTHPIGLTSIIEDQGRVSIGFIVAKRFCLTLPGGFEVA